MHSGYFNRHIITSLLASCMFLFSYAQPVLKTSVDKSSILIGDQLHLKYEAGFDPSAYQVNWPDIPTELPHFEVVNTRFDTVYTNNNISSIVHVLTLTSFDSGKWTFPSFKINFLPIDKAAAVPLYTDSVPVTVSFSTSDTTSTLKDIKPIRQVETVTPLWYWLAGAALLLLLAILFAWLYKRSKRKKPVLPIAKTNLPAYDEAMQALEALRKYNFDLPSDARLVHNELATILKQYLSRRQGINCLNKTTGDILILLRDQQVTTDALASAAASLRCSDAVKFAKYLPPASETANCLETNKQLITAIHHQKPNPLS